MPRAGPMARCGLLLAFVLASALGTSSHAVVQHTARRHGVAARRLQQAAAAGNVINTNSSMSASTWPLPTGYLPLYRSVFRMVGRDMVQQRAAMEAGWRTYLEQDAESGQPGTCTIRFQRYTEHPSTTSGLEALESVDEEATVYIRAANETAVAQLTPTIVARSLGAIEAALRQAGVNATIVAMSAVADPAPAIIRAQLAAGDIAQTRAASNYSVLGYTFIGINTPDDRSLLTSADVQTAFLLGLADAVTRAPLPVDTLTLNLTNWFSNARRQAGANGGQSAQTADGSTEVWFQYEGKATDALPDKWWSAIVPLLPAATAKLGYKVEPVSHLLSSSTSLATANGTAVSIDSLAAVTNTTNISQQQPTVPAPLIGVAVAMTVFAIALLAALFAFGRAYLRQRRLRRQAGRTSARKAEQWLHDDPDEGVWPAEHRLFIEDGADGCWVTFETNAAGKPVLIGRGAFSKVYLGHRAAGQRVALKVLSAAAAAQPATLKKLEREVGLMRHVSRDANVVQFYGASLQHVADAVLVMEYCAGGNLRRLLSDAVLGPQLLWRNQGRRIALDAARGLAYVHSCDVVHRDVKSSNILLDGSGRAKVADVGLACHLHTVDMGLAATEGTFVYLPPEVLLGTSAPADTATARAAAKAGDCYAFGVVLWELVTGELPIRAKMRGVEVDVECCEVAVGLIEACLSQRISERPTAEQLVTALEALQDVPDPPAPMPAAAADGA